MRADDTCGGDGNLWIAKQAGLMECERRSQVLREEETYVNGIGTYTQARVTIELCAPELIKIRWPVA